MTRWAQSGLRRSLGFALTAVVLAGCSSAPSPVSPAWRAHLPGAVDGSPAIADDTVIAGSAGGELAAFDRRTGGAVWRRDGLGPISDSPAVDAGRVFVGTLAGHVLSFSAADGTPGWDWQGPADSAFWSSPVVYRGLVIIGISSPYGDTPLVPGRLVAVDEQSGVLRWTLCLRAGCAPGDGVWSTVAIDGGGAGFVGVGNPGDGVLAFDPLTGTRKWQVSLYPDQERDFDVGTRPAIVSTGGRELVEVGTVEGTFAALDATDGTVLWSRKLVDGSAVHGFIASPAFDGTNMYVASASPPGGVFALRATTGASVWHQATGLPVYSAPAVARGVVVFGSGAVFGDFNAGTLTALSTADGKPAWTYDTGSAVRGGPVIVGNLVIAGDYAGDLIALRVSWFS